MHRLLLRGDVRQTLRCDECAREARYSGVTGIKFGHRLVLVGTPKFDIALHQDLEYSRGISTL